MARLARIVLAGLPHHVTHRGNRKQDIFINDADRRTYLRLLLKYSRARKVRIWAYALMNNHIHLICVPTIRDSLARMLRDVHGDYAFRFNRRHGASGHLWQGRFYSTLLDDAHLVAATRYVERNPVRAGIVERAESYAWSSAAGHCGLRRDPVVARDLPLLAEIPDWREWLHGDELRDGLERLRSRTRTGRPLGSAEFILDVEEQLGRRVRPLRPGPRRRIGAAGGRASGPAVRAAIPAVKTRGG